MHTLVRFTEFSHHVAFLSGITIAHQNPTVILIIVFDTIYEIPSNESVVLCIPNAGVEIQSWNEIERA